MANDSPRAEGSKGFLLSSRHDHVLDEGSERGGDGVPSVVADDELAGAGGEVGGELRLGEQLDDGVGEGRGGVGEKQVLAIAHRQSFGSKLIDAAYAEAEGLAREGMSAEEARQQFITQWSEFKR